jgi:PAS domain S-box-containing protein
MKKKNRPKEKESSLRRRAEELFKGKSENLDPRFYPCLDRLSTAGIEKLIHELQVHQIELEIQNEELRRAQSELEESRNKYADLYDFAPVGYFTISEKGIIQDVNLTGAALLGAEKGTLVNKRFSQYILADSQDRFYYIRKNLIESAAKQTAEVRMLRRDGAMFYAHLEGVAVFDRQGNFRHYRIALLDITERKLLEEELNGAQKLESLGVLAGGIAHDFNNILTVILGSVSLARMVTDPEVSLFKRLEEVERAALRAKVLTDKLLTFASGGGPVKKTTSIAGVLKDAVDFVLTGSNVKRKFIIPGHLWPAEVDEGQISHVFSNLAINACQAMPNGGMIKVRAENVEGFKPSTSTSEGLPAGHGKFIKITMEDQGIGIPKENLQRIFEPYFTTKQRGSGLGLATAYSIVKNHEGEIGVESELGVGTTFTIYIPASEKEPLTKNGVEKEKLLTGCGKILVMDDEEEARRVLSNMLSHLGYEFEFAVDGHEAIELYQRALKSGEPFDAVMLDLTIPGGMNGKEAMKKLLRLHPEIRAIVSSGYSNDPVMAEFKRYGFKGIIAKPYRIEELSRILYELVLG